MKKIKNVAIIAHVDHGKTSLVDEILKYTGTFRENEKREIDEIFCSGDLTNGNYCNRPSYLAYSKIYQSEEMIDYVANNHPYSDYIKFYTIAGNHDQSYYFTENLDICAEIAKLRPDIIYLGSDLADITLGYLKMRLYHGCDKKRVSMEDRVTRFYNKIDGNFKPDIFQLGHIHHSLYMPIDNTHIFQTAALIDQLPYSNRGQFPCERSCWYVTIEYDENDIPYKVIPEIEMFGMQRLRK